jgi:hypothetical protein
MDTPLSLDDVTFESEIVSHRGLSMVALLSSSGRAKESIEAAMALMSDDARRRIRVAICRAGECPITTARFGDAASSSLVFFRDGNPLGALHGELSSRELASFLDRLAHTLAAGSAPRQEDEASAATS